MKKTLERMVWSVLKHFPEARNSDITLTQEVWKNFYMTYLIQREDKFYVEIQSLFKLPREDHIKRIRAKIQNVDRQWLPTTFEVFFERIKLSQEWKSYLGYWVGIDDQIFEKQVRKYYEGEKQKQLSLI